jgi:hypothetical protein
VVVEADRAVRGGEETVKVVEVAMDLVIEVAEARRSWRADRSVREPRCDVTARPRAG